MQPHAAVPATTPSPSSQAPDPPANRAKIRAAAFADGEPGTAGPGKLGKVGVGHLAMADDPLNGNVGVVDIVGPEFVPGVGGGPVENCLRGDGRLAFADEQAHQAALGDWAGREVSAEADKPVLSGHMVDVIVDEQVP